MKILVVAATTAELRGLFNHLGLPEEEFIQTEKFDILITGVGMTATAFALGRHLNPAYSLVINLGIAGSFNRDLPLGALVNITSDQFAELGAEDGENFISLDELGFGRSRFTTSYTHPLLSEIPEGRGITVNTVHGNDERIAEVVNRLQPDMESMEGASVFYCCEKMDIPVLQIRTISNYVERRNRDNWQIGLAVRNLNEFAISFLEKH